MLYKTQIRCKFSRIFEYLSGKAEFYLLKTTTASKRNDDRVNDEQRAKQTKNKFIRRRTSIYLVNDLSLGFPMPFIRRMHVQRPVTKLWFSLLGHAAFIAPKHYNKIEVEF